MQNTEGHVLPGDPNALQQELEHHAKKSDPIPQTIQLSSQIKHRRYPKRLLVNSGYTKQEVT